MHALIWFITTGEEEGEALATVEDCVMEWTNKYGVDYYSMPDEKFFKERWGERKVIPLDSEEGKKLVEELITENVNVMHEEFEKAEEAINKKDLDDALYHLKMAGGHPYSMNAFTDTGEPLISEEQVDAIRKNASANEEKVWLVPVDIHY